MIFAFDVDGTLTPSREHIDVTFKPWLINFIKNNYVILVTGSDRSKTIEQVGEDIFNSVEYCFNCAGNEVYRKGELYYRNEWKPSEDLLVFLRSKLQASSYPERCGNHIEVRTGLVNFSSVGRNASLSQRSAYYEWDKVNKERISLSNEIKQKFPKLDAQVGGEISIDIFEIGKDKSQVLNYFDEDIIFFGDRLYVGGNDYTLGAAIVEQNRGSCVPVKNWKETWEKLNESIHKQTKE